MRVCAHRVDRLFEECEHLPEKDDRVKTIRNEDLVYSGFTVHFSSVMCRLRVLRRAEHGER
jgi:hypothetical protein